MVNKYNLLQWMRIVFSVVLSAVAFVITYAFFYFALEFVLNAFDLPGQNHVLWIAGGLTGITAIAGFWHGLSGADQTSFMESDFFDELGSTGGGSYVQAEYAWNVGAPAYVISQIVLAGPLQLLKAWKRYRTLIPNNGRLEADLKALLDEVRAIGRWHEISSYPGREQQVGYLIRMNKVEFSPRTGKLKALT